MRTGSSPRERRSLARTHCRLFREIHSGTLLDAPSSSLPRNTRYPSGLQGKLRDGAVPRRPQRLLAPVRPQAGNHPPGSVQEDAGKEDDTANRREDLVHISPSPEEVARLSGAASFLYKILYNKTI